MNSAGRGAVLDVLRRFDQARSGVLVGTQMVAKGHDFPDVTLGVVIDADSTLRFPDFRAEERTFALVAQLAGRSGRGARGGKVILISDAAGIAAAGDGCVATIAMPIVHPLIAPLVYAVPVQLLAYHVAVAKGTDVDQPRNLAKSVTVE